MKPCHNLSFSCDQNRIEYHYIPENQYPYNSIFDNLNLCPIYERSLSSSFLPMPQIPQSTNSSFSIQPDLSKLRSKSSEVKVEAINQNKRCYTTKLEISELPSSFAQLGLELLVPPKKLSTKNVLRNYGNAQNQYILHNKYVQSELTDILQNKGQFERWIRRLKLLNFQDYQSAWGSSETDSRKLSLFKKIYKKYCWKFYQQQCIPYIFNSRLTPDNKKSHLLQVHKMLTGISKPSQFQGFRQ